MALRRLVIFVGIVLTIISAGAGNAGVKQPVVPTHETQLILQNHNNIAVGVGVLSEVAISDDANPIEPMSVKAVDSGYQFTPARDHWGYALVEGPATIHSQNDVQQWHSVEVPAGECAIVVSWGRQFTAETTNSAFGVATSMSKEVYWALLNKWVDGLDTQQTKYSVYEVKDSGISSGEIDGR